MHLDSAEAVLHNGCAYQGGDATSVALRVHEGETVKSIRSTANDAGDVPVGLRIIGMEGGEEHGAIDAGLPRAPEVGVERGVGVPRPTETVSLSRVAMRIDDHLADLLGPV